MGQLFAVPDKVDIGEFARSSANAISGAELRAMFGSNAPKRAVNRGELARVLPDVYASTLHARSFHVRAQAASLWSGSPVSGVAALFLWGLIDTPPHVIEVIATDGHKLVPPAWVKVRRTAVEIPASLRDGVRVVSPAAAVVLGYGNVPASRRAEVVFGGVRRGLVGVRQLEGLLALLPRVKCRKSLERRVRAASEGAQSFLEQRGLERVFNTREFAGLVRQHEVVVEGNQFFLDMFDRATMTAIELDGGANHTRAGRQRDITRDAWVATAGILTLRFSYEDIMDRPEWCRAVVREVLRTRSAQQECMNTNN